MSILTPQGVDETHAECVERAQRLEDMAFRQSPPDHDAHVAAWRMATWDMIEELAWLRRQEKAIADGH